MKLINYLEKGLTPFFKICRKLKKIVLLYVLYDLFSSVDNLLEMTIFPNECSNRDSVDKNHLIRGICFHIE